ncbi:glucosaminidase domain-containing protein [Patescibacteria group bacterium]|nr:glucosaminidase domain-containing protein [Patescibacteria group bacterium]
MKKRKHHLDNLYLLNKELKEKSQPFLLNDLKRGVKKIQPDFFDLPLARYILRTKKDSTLLPNGKRGRMKKFFTDQSGRYLVFSATTSYRKVDSLFFGPRQSQPQYIYATSLIRGDIIWEELKKKYSSWSGFFSDLAEGSIPKVSLVRAWNVSIIGAVIFGMVTMTFIYRYLGESVSAKIDEEKAKTTIQMENRKGQVLGAENYATDEAEVEFITKLIESYGQNEKKDALEKEIRAMVKGYPIESMVPEIAKQDRIVAAFLVAIAKKESGWGIHVPVYQGQDCHNLWGWRGKNPVGSGGHTCFDSPKDAINTVAKRIAILIDEYGRNTPEKMVVWKCGSDCEATGGQAAANKWISDVNLYFKKLNK